MRRLTSTLLALGAAGLLSLAVNPARADDGAPFAPLPTGQTLAPPTTSTTADAAAPTAPAAPARVVAPPTGAPLLQEACGASCCEPCLKKVCVPEQAVRTRDRRVYGDTCEDFCVPKCELLGGLSTFGHHKHDDCCDACPAHGCGEGGCAQCSQCIRTRKFLVVKIRHEEECYTKCNVAYEQQAPACCPAPACDAHVVLPPATTPMPSAEKMLTPKSK
jgi:hypothetical protein